MHQCRVEHIEFDVRSDTSPALRKHGTSRISALAIAFHLLFTISNAITNHRRDSARLTQRPHGKTQTLRPTTTKQNKLDEPVGLEPRNDASDRRNIGAIARFICVDVSRALDTAASGTIALTRPIGSLIAFFLFAFPYQHKHAELCKQ